MINFTKTTSFLFLAQAGWMFFKKAGILSRADIFSFIFGR